MAESISIVIAAESGLGGPVGRCLASLRPAADLDVHVVFPQDALGPESRAAPLDASFPVQVQQVPGRPTRAQLRAAGLRAAQANAVAVLNEDYQVAPGWLEAVRASAGPGSEVVCGQVDPPSGAGLAARAAYLWEYSHLLPPLRSGVLPPEEARWVPAGCVIYRGRARNADWLARAPSELDYHQAMAEAGVEFRREPSIRVSYHPPPWRAFLADRRRWSHDGALSRFGARPALSRFLTAVSRLALGPLLLARLAVRIAPKPRLWLPCLLATPLFAAFAAAETVGEVAACFGTTPVSAPPK